MKPKRDKTLQFLARERELCEFSEDVLRTLVNHYEGIKSFRSARYYIQSEASAILDNAERTVTTKDQEARLLYPECLIIASCFQDARVIAEQFGDATTSDYAHVRENEWLCRSDFRSHKLFSPMVRSFWGLTSKYGTDACRLLSSVLAVVVFFAVLYTPTPEWLAKRLPMMPTLELKDDRGASTQAPFLDALYFSLITVTTVGYGDVKPVNTLARLIVPIEAILGVCLFGVFVTVVTRRVPPRVMGSPIVDQFRADRGKEVEKEVGRK